jgi:hypothetical protein
MVIISGRVSQATENTEAFMSFSVDGTTTSSVLDERAVSVFAPDDGSSGTNNSEDAAVTSSTTTVVSGLSAASHTFTLQYRVSGGTGTFSQRTITVIPLS